MQLKFQSSITGNARRKGLGDGIIVHFFFKLGGAAEIVTTVVIDDTEHFT